MNLAAAQPARNNWVGKWVLPKNVDYELRDRAGGVIANPGQFELLQVERVEGNRRLWVRGVGRRLGWIPIDQVVTGEAAIEHFTNAIKDNGENWYAYTARGKAWEIFRSDLDKAIADYTAAIRLSPRDMECYYFRAQAYLGKKNHDRALADFNRAIRIAPSNGSFFLARTRVWIAKKDYENAIADFDDAIRLAPRYALAYNNRAWLLATCPSAKGRNGKGAVESAKEACRLTSWNYNVYVDTLAAAYAEAGDFESAVQWQTKAISLTRDETEKADYRTRLKLYREKKAYHLQEDDDDAW